jgi:hypothetical protein
MRTVCSFQPRRLLDAVRWLFLISVVSAIAVLPAIAQIDRAVLEGTVLDPSGAAIVGAGVKILAVDTHISQEQQTNSKGYYRFPGVAVGSYTVTATSRGFKTKEVEEVILRVGQTRTLDVSLEVGGSTEKVEVEASSSPSNRSSAEASTVIDASQIANLPNNGRDWPRTTAAATREPFGSRAAPATTTIFRSTASTPAAFRNRHKNRKRVCRFPRTQSKNIVSAALCTMPNTAPKRVAKSTWSRSPELISCMVPCLAT